MPSTTPYGFEFEAGESEIPGRTLHGADGTSPILAEQVNDELQRVDEDIADLQTQVGRGWTPIGSGEETDNFTIDLTAGGEFPAGTFSLIKIYYRGTLSEETFLQQRVNSDDTTDLHRRGWLVWAASSGNIVENDASDATAWRTALWSSAAANTAEVTIFETDRSSILSMQSSATRVATGTTLRWRTLAHGDLNAARLLDSIEVFPLTGSIEAMSWHAEGYRP